MILSGDSLRQLGPRVAEVAGVELEDHVQEQDGVRYLDTSAPEFIRARLQTLRRRARARKEQEHDATEAV